MTTANTISDAMTSFRINGTTPFHSPGDNADEALAQAHALLTLLAGAHNVCDAVTDAEADAYDNIRNEITARALDGIGTLIAFAMHNHDIARDRAGRA